MIAQRISFADLTPSQRLFALNSSLNDRDKAVRDECTTMIIGSWLKQCGV
jgi:hypothetical protein